MRTYPYRDTDGALVCIDTDTGTVLLLNDGGEPTGQTRVPTEDEQALIDGQRMEDEVAPIRAAANAAAEQAQAAAEQARIDALAALSSPVTITGTTVATVRTSAMGEVERIRAAVADLLT